MSQNYFVHSFIDSKKATKSRPKKSKEGNRNSSKLTRLEVKVDVGIIEGVECRRNYVELDNYVYRYCLIMKFFNFWVGVASLNAIPFEGYIIPFQDYSPEVSEFNVLVEPPIFQVVSQYAIKFRVLGGYEKRRGYSAGSRVEFTFVYLSVRIINEFASWRRVSLPWLSELFYDFGIHPDTPTAPPDYRCFMDEQFRINGIYEFFHLNEKLSGKQRLLLTIALLFNHWEITSATKATRATHLEQLGFKYELSPRHIGLYFAEAGCIRKSPSQLLGLLQKLPRQAWRYFEQDEIVQKYKMFPKAGESFKIYLDGYK